MKVVKGIIHKSKIIIPPGPSGLLHLWVTDGGFQFFPASAGETFWGDNIDPEYDDIYEITDENRILKIYAYNLDTAYAHSFQIQFSIESRDIYMARYIPSMQVALFEAEMNRLREGDKAQRQELIKRAAERYGVRGIE